MRAVFTFAGLLIVLAIVGVLIKKQLSAVNVTPAQLSSYPEAGTARPAVLSGATPQVQSQQIQLQIKQSVEAAMQLPRTIPDAP